MIRSITLSAATLALASTAFAGGTKGSPQQNLNRQWDGSAKIQITDRQQQQQAGQAGQAGQASKGKVQTTMWQGDVDVLVICRDAAKAAQQGKGVTRSLESCSLSIDGDLNAAKADKLEFKFNESYNDLSEHHEFEIALEGTDKLLVGHFMAPESVDGSPMVELALVREGNLTPDTYIKVELKQSDRSSDDSE